MSAKAKRITTQDINGLNEAYRAAQAQTQQAQNNAAKYSAASSYSGSKAGANAGISALSKTGTTTKATQGLLPKTDYDWNNFIGNTNAMVNGMKNAGYVTDTSKASNFNTAGNVNNKAWSSNIEAIKAKYPDLFAGTSGVGYTPASYSTIGNVAAFAPSQAYIDAMNVTNQMLEKLNSGRTSYSEKVDMMMDKIANRDAFSYDFNTDPLFQNMLGAAMASGQTAMQDTMGQAASLTGGYGSSYATSVGNQAYNQFVADAYAQLPEYYKIAQDAYTREGEEMYNQLGMYRTADDTEYNRNLNAYSANYQQAQDMYNQEYANYWDTTKTNLDIDMYNADAATKAANENWNRQMDMLNYNTKASNAQASAAGGASDSQFNKALQMAQDLVDSYGLDNDQTDAGIARILDMYGVSDAQANTLMSQLIAYEQQRKAKLAPTIAKASAKRSASSTASILKQNK